MLRKTEAYEAMARGECLEPKNCLIDFELKQLQAPVQAPAARMPPLPTLLSPDMERDAERRRWEAEAGEEIRRPGGGSVANGLQRYEQRTSMLEKRLLSEAAEETESGRAAASEQKQKRQRALEERRAMLRLRQESRQRANEAQKAAQPLD